MSTKRIDFHARINPSVKERFDKIRDSSQIPTYQLVEKAIELLEAYLVQRGKFKNPFTFKVLDSFAELMGKD